MLNIDDIDGQIITLLEHDARQSSKVIAKQINMSSATVRRRLKRLVDSKTVSIIAIRGKPEFPVSALIGFVIEYSLRDQVIALLRNLPEVVWATTTTGRFDAFILGRFRSNEDFALWLRNKLTKIKGITRSETFMCLRVEKRFYKIL